MPRWAKRTPEPRLHRTSGQARICLNGHEHYLGPWGSEEARVNYAKFLRDWASTKALPPEMRPAEPITVSVAVFRFSKWAEQRFRHRDGTPTREADNLNLALRPLRRKFGELPLAEFGPAKLYAIQAALVAEGLGRTTVNDRVAKIRRFVRWCVGREMCPPSVVTGLEAVEPVRAGQGAREVPRRRPATWEAVERTLPHLPEMLRALVLVLWHTGARVGEVTKLTTRMIDQTGDVWRATLEDHKTAHHGRSRVLLLGPGAISAIRPWLQPDAPDAVIFSPRRVNEHTSTRRGSRPPGERYHRSSLPQAIRRAIELANTPEEGQAPPDPPIPAWTLAQLRHAAATRLRERHGIEVAATVLGHSRPDMTAHYSATAIRHAVDVMRDAG